MFSRTICFNIWSRLPYLAPAEKKYLYNILLGQVKYVLHFEHSELCSVPSVLRTIKRAAYLVTLDEGPQQFTPGDSEVLAGYGAFLAILLFLSLSPLFPGNNRSWQIKRAGVSRIERSRGKRSWSSNDGAELETLLPLS